MHYLTIMAASRVIRDGKARDITMQIDYVARILARSKHYKDSVSVGPRSKNKAEACCTMVSNNHAKPKKRAGGPPHINQVDELADLY